MENSNVYINGIAQMNMVASRFLTKGDFNNAINVVENTRIHYLNGKSHNAYVVSEALEVLIHNYGEIQSKIALNTDFGKLITEHLFFYIEERKNLSGKRTV